MTYTEIDRHDHAACLAEVDADFLRWYGEEYDVDPEERRYVDFNEVEEPDTWTVRVPDFHIVPGADD
jgi:hypothetical protein